jgi:hypothetical protein
VRRIGFRRRHGVCAYQRDGTWQEKMVHAFRGNSGGNPLAGLTLGKNRELYGTVSQGHGACQINPEQEGWSCGAVFKITE